MRHALALLTVVAVLAGCDSSAYKPGDRVVARWNNGFREGTVLKAEGGLLTLQWDTSPPELAGVPRTWVTRTDFHPSPEPGAWVLCPDDDSWTLCRASAVTGSSAVIEGADEKVSTEELLPVPAALAGWAAREGPRQLARTSAADLGGEWVPATAGRSTRSGASVLAQWTDGSWWEAQVRSVDGASVTVAWRDGSAPSALRSDQVAPLVDSPELRGSGAPAFCKGGDTRWRRAAVTHAPGGSLDVAYEDGSHASARPGECVAARPAKRPH